MADEHANRLLTPAEAAEYVGLTEETLLRWRMRGQGPAFLKLGRKVVRYSRADIDAWAEARRVAP